MFARKPLNPNLERLFCFLSAFCMIIAGYQILFFNLNLIIEYFITSNPHFSIFHLGVIIVIIISVAIGWFIANFQSTVFTLNYCGTKYSGISKTNDGYISTIWLIIFEIPILPVKSMWFNNDNPQIPGPLEHIYLPQVFSTIGRSIIKILLVNVIIIILFSIIKFIVLAK